MDSSRTAPLIPIREHVRFFSLTKQNKNESPAQQQQHHHHRHHQASSHGERARATAREWERASEREKTKKS